MVCDGKIGELEGRTKTEMQTWVCYKERGTGMGTDIPIAEYCRPRYEF